MKTAILYHQTKPGTDCPDGIASAWVAQRKFPDATVLGVSYNYTIPDVGGFEKIIIVDFSFPLSVLQEWSLTKDVLVIDHHKTAMEDLSQFENAIFDMSECGATLTWKYFFPNESMPAFLNYVKDRDLWKFELPYSRQIHEATSFLGRKFYQLDFLASLSQSELADVLVPLGEKLLVKKQEKVKEISKNATAAKVDGQDVMVVRISPEDSRLTSDVCSYIGKQYPKVPFVVAYTVNSEEMRFNLEFRSSSERSNYDVAEVARKFNGGGHRNASGGYVKNISDLFSR